MVPRPGIEHRCLHTGEQFTQGIDAVRDYAQESAAP